METTVAAAAVPRHEPMSRPIREPRAQHPTVTVASPPPPDHRSSRQRRGQERSHGHTGERAEADGRQLGERILGTGWTPVYGQHFETHCEDWDDEGQPTEWTTTEELSLAPPRALTPGSAPWVRAAVPRRGRSPGVATGHFRDTKPRHGV
jgi:hypothetical protein